MLSQFKTENEELDKLRKDVLESTVNWKQEIEELLQQVDGFHSSWLCFPLGDECMKKLCLFVSSISNSVDGNWKAFAAALGLTYNETMYIYNTNHSLNTDRTELVLRVYSQHSNSNLQHVIKSLQNIKRIDVIKQLEEPLIRMVAEIKALLSSDNMANNIFEKNDNEGNHLNATEQLIAPRNYQKEIRFMLPKALLLKQPNRQTEIILQQITSKAIEECQIQNEVLVTRQNIQRESSALPSPVTSKPISQKPKINVFLSFANDGAIAARRIAKQMRTALNERPEFGVLILDENAEKILRNPEILINRLFYQVHYIIPILTQGYMEAINSNESNELRSSMDSLDASYAKFVHSLMITEYTENNCRNERFRCVIPKVDNCALQDIIRCMKKPGNIDPTLRAYIYEKDLETFLRRLVGLYY